MMAQVDSKHPLAGDDSMKAPKKKSSTKASARAARAARSRAGSRARLSQLKRGSKSAVTSPRSSTSSAPKQAVEQKQSEPKPSPIEGSVLIALHVIDSGETKNLKPHWTHNY